MRKEQFKVLCFTYEDYGRDIEMLLPLRYFAERFLNCRFEHAFVYDVHAIYRKKPDVVCLPNTIGSALFFEISKYAHEQEIPVFALVSEGNFRTDGSFNYWGYNTAKQFYQEYICAWSQRTGDFLKAELPELEDRIVVTGGTGFDRYSIYKFADRQEMLNKYDKEKYKKVIGYAGWAFGKLTNEQGRGELLYYFKNDTSRLDWCEEQRQKVEAILRELIENNPDTLFLLKKHPNEQNPSIIGECLNEMLLLENYPNVVYIKENENIHDLINVSDLWMAFESTTAIEAWLLDRQTLLINPDPDFGRDELYKGSVIYSNYETLQQAIDEYYSVGRVNDFFHEELISQRNRIIRETIGFGDGCNHIRAAYYFEKTLNKSLLGKVRRKFSVKFFVMYALMHIGKYFYNKRIFSKLYKFKKTIWIFENFRLKNIPKLYGKYSSYLNHFYQVHEVEDKYKNGVLFKELLEEKNHA